MLPIEISKLGSAFVVIETGTNGGKGVATAITVATHLDFDFACIYALGIS